MSVLFFKSFKSAQNIYFNKNFEVLLLSIGYKLKESESKIHNIYVLLK